MRRAELPKPKDLVNRSDEVQEQVHLMDGLADERTSAFSGPASLDWPCVVLAGTKPFDVRIRLQKVSQSALVDCLLEKKDGVIEAMLADDAELNARLLSHGDHSLRGVKIDGHGLLHKYVFSASGTEFHGGKAISRERADIDEVDFRVAAELLDSLEEFRTGGVGEFAATFRVGVCAGSQLVANIPVGFGVLPRDRARSDNSNSHLVPRRACFAPAKKTVLHGLLIASSIVRVARQAVRMLRTRPVGGWLPLEPDFKTLQPAALGEGCSAVGEIDRGAIPIGSTIRHQFPFYAMRRVAGARGGEQLGRL